ncbi:HAD hydrolase-like protein [Nostoc sp. UIC 10607]|uniref:HAD hydrolase-like protein n=1 Tax=Nostoc sp. UIC 10607 TaxID=3045935 RepID=UPI0039A25909
MSQKLKCVIFGDRYVIQDDEYLPEIEKLLKFLDSRSIKAIILSNDDFTEHDDRVKLREKLIEKHQYLDWHIADADKTLRKPSPGAVHSILNQFHLNNNEAIYIGNSDIDMQTAVNSKLLFLNATWYEQQTKYGFNFQQPKDIAHFIDIFCLREHLWSYEIKDGDLEYYALGIYGTREEKYDYSLDAREAAKFGRGHPDFWIKYLLSAVYFSGLHERINYIAPYPGHEQGSTSSMETETITTFAKCFRKSYLLDLIQRHTTSQKSSYARTSGIHLDHFNQLNTVLLNQYPLQNERGNRYKHSPLKRDKTVLVIDDFCTQGYSLEAARVYIQKTGAKVILLSLLKTIWKDYEKILEIEKLSPFKTNQLQPPLKKKKYPFWNYIREEDASQEIRSKLREYDTWSW